MAVSTKSDIRVDIKEWLDANERTLGWLSTKTGYNYHTLYSIFIQKTVKLSEDKLLSINTLLGTKFKN
jgi:hypothetical protein